MECIIFIGLQASGKSAFYRERFFRTHVRVNLDMLRTRHRERCLIEACLGIQQSFVVDNTNPTKEDRRKYVEVARAAGCRVYGYYFRSEIEQCKRRNESRPDDERVPLAGVLGTYGRLELPDVDLVVDYFRWRNEDAHRNALNAHCYWCLRKDGLGVDAATAQLVGRSVADKNELLFQHGINFNDLPLWQRRGVGLYWENYEKQAVNPLTGQEVVAQRRRIYRDLELPMKDAYSEFVRKIAGGEDACNNART